MTRLGTMMDDDVHRSQAFMVCAHLRRAYHGFSLYVVCAIILVRTAEDVVLRLKPRCR